jgi:hypothetical protein
MGIENKHANTENYWGSNKNKAVSRTGRGALEPDTYDRSLTRLMEFPCTHPTAKAGHRLDAKRKGN